MTDNAPFLAVDGYSRAKAPEQILVRRMTTEEARWLRGNEVEFIGNDGTLRRAKITSVKTWKRSPERVEVWVKYGMYEYGHFAADGAYMAGLVVRV